MKHHFTLPVLIISSVLPAFAAEQAETVRTISTFGDSVVYATPDKAVISFGVTTFDPSLEVVRDRNNKAAEQLSSAVKTLGVDPKNFATDDVSISLRYEQGGYGATGKVIGYEARRGYMITLTDMAALPTAVETILKGGANTFSGITFQSTQLRKHRDEARRMAIRAAKEKATELAGELGCTLGLPRTVKEEDSSSRPFYSQSQSYMNSSSEAAPSGEPSAASDILPLGQIEITAKVSVTFDLEPAPPVAP